LKLLVIRYTVKKVDEVVQHLYSVTQDQFRLVSEKVSDILEDNYTINIELFQLNFLCVKLLRYKHIPHVEILDEDRRTSPIDCSFLNVELLRQSLKRSTTGGRTCVLSFIV
jgi:hypothetical protein